MSKVGLEGGSVTCVLAGVAALLSVAAVAALFAFVPLLSGKAGTIKQELQLELGEFERLADALWADMQHVRLAEGRPHTRRAARQVVPTFEFNQLINFGMPVCSCTSYGRCPPGRGGAVGAAGDDGESGQPGGRGPPGEPGRPYPRMDMFPPGCKPCPRGQNGPPGSRGRPGLQGVPGGIGDAGTDGNRGRRGNPGLSGPPGDAGQPGNPGIKGEPGFGGTRAIKGTAGQPGAPGERGPRGPPGAQGNDGSYGLTGRTGEQGPEGLYGERGFGGTPGQGGRPGEPGEDAGYCPCPRRDAAVQKPSPKPYDAGYGYGAEPTDAAVVRPEPGYVQPDAAARQPDQPYGRQQYPLPDVAQHSNAGAYGSYQINGGYAKEKTA